MILINKRRIRLLNESNVANESSIKDDHDNLSSFLTLCQLINGIDLQLFCNILKQSFFYCYHSFHFMCKDKRH